MLMGHGATGPVASRLVAAAYRGEQEAADKVMRPGSGLHEAMLRIALDERFDAKRLSIDILNRADVEEAYSTGAAIRSAPRVSRNCFRRCVVTRETYTYVKE